MGCGSSSHEFHEKNQASDNVTSVTTSSTTVTKTTKVTSQPSPTEPNKKQPETKNKTQEKSPEQSPVTTSTTVTKTTKVTTHSSSTKPSQKEADANNKTKDNILNQSPPRKESFTGSVKASPRRESAANTPAEKLKDEKHQTPDAESKGTEDSGQVNANNCNKDNPEDLKGTDEKPPKGKKPEESGKDVEQSKDPGPSKNPGQSKEADQPQNTATSKEADQNQSTATSKEVDQNQNTASPNQPSTSAAPKAEPEVYSADMGKNGQEQFDAALRCTCLMTKPDELYKRASEGDVTRLTLTRALPYTVNLADLLLKLSSLQVLEINGNQLGPQPFRAIMYALATNTTVRVLNIADNRADTDSAVSIGKMLSTNRSLTSLNVSGNHLGNDFFSRCVGPALSSNNVLQRLICESIGATDLTVLSDNLKDNACLTELCVTNNQLRHPDKFIKGISTWMHQTGCSLQVLKMKTIGLSSSSVSILQTALQNNTSLLSLDVTGNEMKSSGELLDFVQVCCTHPSLAQLAADNIRLKPQAWTPGIPWSGTSSRMTSLSLSSCQLQDHHFTTMSKHLGKGTLCSLTSLDLSSNSELTVTAMQAISQLTNSDNESSIERLNMSLTSPACVTSLSVFPNLHYLNVRKAGSQLPPTLPSQTLVLDGNKLSGATGLSDMFQNLNLAALSLSGCQLTDVDVAPLFAAIKSGALPLCMLKLSANRLGDQSMEALVGALTTHKQHTLGLLDASNNKITSAGAKKLSELYTTKKHKSQLHSLNLASNSIEKDGISSLVSMIGKGTLISVNFSQQEVPYEQNDMDHIFTQVVKTMGLTLKEENGVPVKAVSKLPDVSSTFNLKFLSLGGEAGDLGEVLDCMAISTDTQRQRVTNLTMQHAMQIAAMLQGNAGGSCLLSSEEWSQLIGHGKGAPSWLQLSDHRSRAMYVSGLPASITVQKLEGLLEMEADCEVEDICLMKDMITQQNNGLAWLLMSNELSVDRAVDFYNRGEALVFGSRFVLSPLSVQVDDDASSKAQENARQDMAFRMKTRHQEEAAHRKLIQQSYTESQERHAYRLAHPAYADGRIW